MSADTEVRNKVVGRGRIKLLFVLQMLLGLFYVGCVPFLLYLTTSAQVRIGYDPASAIRGLKLGALVCGILAAVTLTSALGLRKRKLWAYILGLGITWLIIVALASGLFDVRPIDWDVLWVMVPYLAIGIFFLLPGTRFQIHQKSA